MSSQAVSGVGAEFRRWGGSSFVPIAEVISIGGPSSTRDTIDVTHLGSTGGYREFIASFRDGGSVNLPLNFRRDTYDIMKGDFESDDLQNYEIILPDPDNTSIEFEGLVIECPVDVPADDKITCQVVIKVSGKPEVNSGSASASPG